jgi:HAD superfamily hydrolase (TIGR01548 family)
MSVTLCYMFNPKRGITMKSASAKLAPAKQKVNEAILFDMDGVLVDVSGSYRKAIQETVRFFTGKKAQLKEIQELKEKGGYNNDWDLTEAILISKGKGLPKTEIVEKFQEFYLGGKENNGFIKNETWLLAKEQLKQLHKKHRLGIVTGRPKEETFFVLRKFEVENFFDVVVTMEDYPPEKSKPDPYPINLALNIIGTTAAIYLGDSVDDIKAAKRADIRAIGCIPLGVSSGQLRQKLVECGAEKVLSRIGDITKVVQ